MEHYHYNPNIVDMTSVPIRAQRYHIRARVFSATGHNRNLTSGL